MTATPPYTAQILGPITDLISTVPPPAPHFPNKFWIALDGKTDASDEAEVQALVDAGRIDLDIMSQDKGSAWTKPAALGFIAKPVLPVSKPTTATPIKPPEPPTDWPAPTPTIPEDSSSPTPAASTPHQPTSPDDISDPARSVPALPSSGETAQPFVLLDFAMALVTGEQTGAKFRLANGGMMASPIPEVGVPITADIVRQALGQVEKEYKRRGLEPGSMNLTEIQEAVVVLAAVLNFQAKLNGEPVSRHLIQFGTAVADFQHTLHVVINSNND